MEQMWPSIIKNAKDGGNNVVQTYVFWNGHEPKQGQVRCTYSHAISNHSVALLWTVHKMNIRFWSGFFWDAVQFRGEIWSGEVHKAGARSRNVLPSSHRSLRLCRMEHGVRRAPKSPLSKTCVLSNISITYNALLNAGGFHIGWKTFRALYFVLIMSPSRSILCTSWFVTEFECVRFICHTFVLGGLETVVLSFLLKYTHYCLSFHECSFHWDSTFYSNLSDV